MLKPTFIYPAAVFSLFWGYYCNMLNKLHPSVSVRKVLELSAAFIGSPQRACVALIDQWLQTHKSSGIHVDCVLTC